MSPDPGGCILAVDVGGTSMKGVVLDGDDVVVCERTVPSRPPGRSAVEVLRGLCADLVGEAGGVVAAGVVTPGLVDEEEGVVAYASNLDFRDLPLRRILSDHLGIPVVVGHDGRAAGLAEGAFGAARGRDDYIVMPIGTGISIAIVTGGQSVPGSMFAAGEVGHMPVYPGGEQCACGQRGCLEVYASAAGIQRRYARAASSRTAGLSDVCDAASVAALLGVDSHADEVWSQATTALGIALATLTLTLDPGLIVLGGGVAAAGNCLITPVQAAVADHLRWRPAPPIVTSHLGPHAARLGAALLARKAADSL